MDGSFILKDKMGRPGGYVMRGGDALRLRATVPSAAQGTLLYADGQRQTLTLAPGAGEQSVAALGTLVGAYVTVDGALTLFTGEAARTAFARQALRESPALHETAAPSPSRAASETVHACAPPQLDCDEAEQTPPHAVEEARSCTQTPDAQAVDWPQPRWPPPPCLRAPRYVEGAWLDAADAREDAQAEESR